MVTDVSKDRDYLILTLKTAETPVTVNHAERLKFCETDVIMLSCYNVVML